MSNPESNFVGLPIAAFESRRADEMTRLIEKQGGVPHVSPSMQAIPIENNPEAVDFAHRLMTGQIDVVIFLTGAGFRHLLGAIERHVDLDRFLDSLRDTVTIARGPKPTFAMKKRGIEPTYRIDAPNTWREILATVDANLTISQSTVAIQEYGKSNLSLIAGLEARGAKVESVFVYRWELPDDLQPLEENIRAIVQGKRDVALFTSAQQVVHLLMIAKRLELDTPLIEAMQKMAVISIGPTTSEMLRENNLPVDLEPKIAKMGQMVVAAAEQAATLIEQKRKTKVNISTPPSDPFDSAPPWRESPFLKACRGEPAEITPIWLMRQAGRYMKEYRDVRKHVSFLDLCRNPQLCSEVMCTAVQRLGVDAAIIFSDLLPILEPMGLELEFLAGGGPVIHNPVREAADIDRIVELESPDPLHYVMETVSQTRADLPDDLPLIGFAGAPFTLASYAIEGGASRNYLHTKSLMYRDEGAWSELLGRLARSVVLYLNAQIAAGAQCVQLFDSWAGCLGVDDYRKFVLPYVQQIIQGITPGVPVINFATGNPALLPLLAEAGPCVVGVDWRIRLDVAWETVGKGRAVQGNLDPTVLLAEVDEIHRQAGNILKQAKGKPGHIFNLGHGVLQQTPVDNVRALIDYVHQESAR